MQVQRHSRWHLILRTWLFLWIATVPLFHLHFPDTTDRWSLHQSSGAHTVFTPDLPGEYASPSHDSHRGSSAHIAARVVNSPELGFIVFGEQAKRWETPGISNSLSDFPAPPLISCLVFTLPISRAPPGSASV
jgi:hypothetical protein